GPTDAANRLVDAAIEAFKTRSYGEVTIADIAEAADVAKGSVYYHFSSKEELFVAAVERVLVDTASRFATTVEDLGGPKNAVSGREKTALEFGRLVADAMPMLLELGARASKGHEPSQELARRVLRTLAAAAGRPLAPDGGDPIPAGLEVIRDAFSVVLTWAVGTEWPPDDDPPPPPPRARVPRLRRRRRANRPASAG
ncbi:MAG TPA: TetR family transcriptional regulator, partial [Acidimicrobiales bacterium]|nr:TetR family transcriptional regulator [Acidimicrobiales bacterium]